MSARAEGRLPGPWRNPGGIIVRGEGGVKEAAPTLHTSPEGAQQVEEPSFSSPCRQTPQITFKDVLDK